MLPSAGYFKTILCPFFENSRECPRPYCHYKHIKSEKNSVDSKTSLHNGLSYRPTPLSQLGKNYALKCYQKFGAYQTLLFCILQLNFYIYLGQAEKPKITQENPEYTPTPIIKKEKNQFENENVDRLWQQIQPPEDKQESKKLEKSDKEESKEETKSKSSKSKDHRSSSEYKKERKHEDRKHHKSSSKDRKRSSDEDFKESNEETKSRSSKSKDHKSSSEHKKERKHEDKKHHKSSSKDRKRSSDEHEKSSRKRSSDEHDKNSKKSSSKDDSKRKKSSSESHSTKKPKIEEEFEIDNDVMSFLDAMDEIDKKLVKPSDKHTIKKPMKSEAPSFLGILFKNPDLNVRLASCN